jgi:ribose 1,5-bisphosphate isomerase
MKLIGQIESDIKNLKIQGATNIALATLEGIKVATDNGINSIKELEKIGKRLAYARPTEPLAQNAIRYIFALKNQPVDYYLKKIQEYESLISEAKNKMAQYGASLLQNGGVYLTHCHSSTVVKMFIQGRKQGKRFSVIASETRPKFQGRITAKELLEGGIEDVTLIIDDVAESLLEGRRKNIDAVFIGADLLSQNGFVNKVGSLGIAFAAERRKTSFYSLSVLLKYDPRPYSPSVIEQRSGYEIWPEAPESLSFYAPAFDYIPYTTGVKIICEEGIIESDSLAQKVFSVYPFLKE